MDTLSLSGVVAKKMYPRPTGTLIPICERLASFTDVTRRTVRRHRCRLREYLQMDGSSSIPGPNTWNFCP